MENKKRVCVYCRVSLKDGTQTTENQKLDLVRYAEAMGWDYEVFEEQESSRKTRPIKNKLFQETIEKKWDGILVWQLSRWARSLQELVNDLDVLKTNKAEFFSLKDNIRLSDSAVDQLLINVLGAFSQFERDVIRERTLCGLARAVASGKKLGRPQGSADKGRRRINGYLLRYAGQKVLA